MLRLKRMLSLYIVIIFQFAVFTRVQAAEIEVPYSITGDYVAYSFDNNIVQVSGNGKVANGGLEITGDSLYLDITYNALRVLGKATVTLNDKVLSGDTIFVNFGSKRIYLIAGDMESVYELNTLEKLPKTELYWKKNMNLVDTSNTKLWYTASRVLYVPKKKLQLDGTRVYLLGNKLMWFPYTNIDLPYSGTSQVFSYDKNKGLIMSSHFDYVLGKNSSGLLKYDIMGKEGVNLDLDHYYQIRDGKNNLLNKFAFRKPISGRAYFGYERTYNEDGTDKYKLQVNSLLLGSWNANFDADLENSDVNMYATRSMQSFQYKRHSLNFTVAPIITRQKLNGENNFYSGVEVNGDRSRIFDTRWDYSYSLGAGCYAKYMTEADRYYKFNLYPSYIYLPSGIGITPSINWGQKWYGNKENGNYYLQNTQSAQVDIYKTFSHYGNASLTYSVTDEKKYNLTSRLSATFTPKYSLYLSLQPISYRWIKDFSATYRTEYDVKNHLFTSGSSSVSTKIADSWAFTVNANYDYGSHQYTSLSTALSRDFDSQTVKLNMDLKQKQYSLEVKAKSF